MIIYIIMLALSILFAYVSTKVETRKEKIISITLSILPFILVSGIRYDVGTDYLYRYLPNYLIFVHGGFISSLEKPRYVIIFIILVLILGGYLENVADFIITNTPLNNMTNIAKYVKYFKMDGKLSISALTVETLFYEKRIDDAVKKQTDYIVHPRRADSERWTREFYFKHV